MKWNGILYPGVVGVKGDDIVYAHMNHFLKGQRTVKGFSGGSLMLSAFIKEGHDYRDPSCLAADCSNNSFQILRVIVRGHMIFMSAQRIGQAVIGYIYKNIKIASADGL